MLRRLGLLLLAGSAWAADDDLDKAVARVRDLEAEIRAVVAKVRPAVGAVVKFQTVFDVKTGVVGLRRVSLGSGVVISRDGFFLTNVHVVEGAGHLTVTLPDGVEYNAELHADTADGRVKGDIAVLRLRGAKSFPFIDWRRGNPRLLKPGSFVFAMGNPHGHALEDGQAVVTMGIISGKGRAAAETGFLYLGVLQTDAEINPGNSGGPLFNSRGELMGINGLMQSRAGRSNSGIGFAIPMDQARPFLKKLLRRGDDMGYGFHGMDVATAPGETGAVVVRVHRGSPADEAGLRRDDVITYVNNKKVKNRADYLNLAGSLPEKALVRITFRRRRNTKRASYRLASYADFLEETGRARGGGKLPLHERGYLGCHWKEGRAGLVLERVLEETGAHKAKLQSGDVVLSVDKAEVKTGAQLAKLLEPMAPGDVVTVSVRRGDRTRTARVELCDVRAAAELEDE